MTICNSLQEFLDFGESRSNEYYEISKTLYFALFSFILFEILFTWRAFFQENQKDLRSYFSVLRVRIKNKE